MENIALCAERISQLFQVESSYEQAQEFRVRFANSRPGNLTGYNCRKCLNRGWSLRINEQGVEVSTPCECLKTRQAMRLAKKSGLDSIIRSQTFDKFTTHEPWQKSLKDSAMKFAGNPSDSWFYVGGNPGSGKTHICTAICREFMYQGREVRYFVWPSDIRRLKSMANDSEYDAVFTSFADADVLYIDDLFKARNISDLTAADISRTFELVNRRDQQPEKTTIFSSEHPINRIVDIDEATGSRIYYRAMNYTFDLGRDRSRNWRLFEGADR